MQITYDPVEHNHIIKTPKGTVIIGRFNRPGPSGLRVYLWETAHGRHYDVAPTPGTDLSKHINRAFSAAFSCDPARVREAFA